MYVKKTTITDWTETLLEVLYSTLRKNEDDTAVKAVVADLKEAGFPVAYLEQTVRQEVGSDAAMRLRWLLTGKRGQNAVATSTRTSQLQPRTANEGIFSSVMNRLRKRVTPPNGRRPVN